MKSYDGFVCGRFDGYYEVHSDERYFINSRGLVLPFAGSGIAFNVYKNSVQ